MVLHYPESIRRFGVARNFIAENFEMAVGAQAKQLIDVVEQATPPETSG